MFEQAVLHPMKTAAKRRPAITSGRLETCSPAPKQRPQRNPAANPNSRKPGKFSECKRNPAAASKAVLPPPVKKKAPRFAAFQSKQTRTKIIQEAGSYRNISARLLKAIEAQKAKAVRAAEKARAAASPPPMQAEEEQSEQEDDDREEDGEQENESEPFRVEDLDDDCPRIIETKKGCALTLCAAIGAGAVALFLTLTTVWLFINSLWQLAVPQIWIIYAFGIAVVIGSMVLAGHLIFMAKDCRRFAVTVRKVVTFTALSAALLVTCTSVFAGFRAGRPVRYRSDAETGGYAASANLPYCNRSIIIADTHRGKPVTRVEEFGFRKNLLLKEITLGIHVEEVGPQAFTGCKNLERVIFRSSNVPTLYESSFRVSYAEDAEAAPFLPKVRFYVPARAFEYYYSKWTGVYRQRLVPYGLTDDMFHIEDGVLRYAYGDAQEMSVPEGVHSVGALAFRFTKPAGVTLPGSVKRIGERAFAGNDRFSTLTLEGDAPPTLGGGVFDQTALTTIFVPDAAVAVYRAAPGWSQYADSIFGIGALQNGFLIDDGTLKRYSGKEQTVTVPETVRHIGYSAFTGNQTMTSVLLPETLLSIGDKAFRACAALSEISIPASVKQVGSQAFYRCKALKRAVFHGSTEFVFEPDDLLMGIFSDCEALEEVVLGDGTKQIPDTMFSLCRNLRSVVIPDSVESIGQGAFMDCQSLKTVALPASLLVVERSAFLGCWNLQNVTLPAAVKQVGAGAFNSCISLGTLICLGAEPPAFGENVFESRTDVPAFEVQVVVPAASLEAYRTALAAQRNVTVTAG